MSGLRNSSGKIVIDEAEAEADIKKLEQINAKLEEAEDLLSPVHFDFERLRGETSAALKDLYFKFFKEFRTSEDQCRTTANFIKAVVNKYKNLDREYAEKARNGGRG